MLFPAREECTSSEEVLPPENFSMVEPGVYRSAFPRTKNIGFIKRLGLKSVIPLVPEGYPVAMAEFYQNSGINLLSHGFDGNKWPAKEIPLDGLLAVLYTILDPSNRPLLVHCNKGKHRTGSVIGCLRKYRGWSLSCIFSEYYMFAWPKARLEDQRCIESFDLSALPAAPPSTALYPHVEAVVVEASEDPLTCGGFIDADVASSSVEKGDVVDQLDRYPPLTSKC